MSCLFQLLLGILQLRIYIQQLLLRHGKSLLMVIELLLSQFLELLCVVESA